MKNAVKGMSVTLNIGCVKQRRRLCLFAYIIGVRSVIYSKRENSTLLLKLKYYNN